MFNLACGLLVARFIFSTERSEGFSYGESRSFLPGKSEFPRRKVEVSYWETITFRHKIGHLSAKYPPIELMILFFFVADMSAKDG